MEERITEVKSTDTKESDESSGEHPTGMSRKEGLQGRDRKVEAKKVSESWRSNEEADEAYPFSLYRFEVSLETSNFRNLKTAQETSKAITKISSA